MSTLGSMVSVAATLVFVFVVAALLAAGGQISAPTDPWYTASVASYASRGDTSPIQSATLEHSLESPTPLHGFKSLPLAVGLHISSPVTEALGFPACINGPREFEGRTHL